MTMTIEVIYVKSDNRIVTMFTKSRG